MAGEREVAQLPVDHDASGFKFVHRKVRVDFGYNLAHSGGGGFGRAGGAELETQIGARFLEERSVSLPESVGSIEVGGKMQIIHHSDDFQPGSALAVAGADAFAQR